jgi:hypothetical protein
MPNYLTFENIYQTVMKDIGDAQYTRTDEVKAIVNQTYLNEILQCDDLYPLYWLVESDVSKLSKVRATATAVTKANPPVVSSAAHGFASGDIVTAYEVTGMPELDYQTLVVVRDSASAFHLHTFDGVNLDASAYTAAGTAGYFHHRGVSLTNCQKILRANWHGYDKGMGFITPDQLEDQATWLDESRSRPTKMMHKQVYTSAGTQIDYLLWYQAADAEYHLRVWYAKQPDTLTNTSDVPLLPPQFHSAIIAGAVTRLGVNAVQVEAGVIWPSIYKTDLDAIRTFNRRWWEENKPAERSGLFLI